MPARDHDSSDGEVRALYRRLLASWNQRDARAYAELFEPDANVIGFDGSQMDGREAIATELSRIFGHHPTRPYVGIVREVRLVHDAVAVLRAVAGMYPPDEKRIDPAVNAIQLLVAVRRDARWLAATFQNTPAAFHGRPELVTALTEELQRALQGAEAR